MTLNIAGYDYGRVAHSPVSLAELRQLEEAVGYTEDDAAILRRHEALFRTHADAMVDSWRAVIGAQPHLVKWFFGPDCTKDETYAAAVKKRFVQWVIDVATRQHNQAWLDYQEEIGLRHTPEKKNRTDGRQTPPVIPMRYLVGFVPVVTLGARKFFAESSITDEELQRLHDAWTRAVQLHIALWTRPYVKQDLW